MKRMRRESGSDIRPNRDASSNSKYAWVTVLWSGKEIAGHLMDALVLGHQLKKHKVDDIDRVLLATSDVFSEPMAPLLGLFWSVKRIEDVAVPELLVSKCRSRFARTFNKLRVIELEEYEKVCLLDCDLLPRRNLDEIFAFSAPAGVFRGNRDILTGVVHPEKAFFDWHGNCIFGINAGVVLLKPSKKDFAEMEECWGSEEFARREASTMPEQQFLSWYYAGKFSELGVKYNYQLHQMLYTDGDNDNRIKVRYDDICILHFSTEKKPSGHFLQGGCLPNVNAFLQGFLKQVKDKSRLTDEVRVRMGTAVNEWFGAWGQTWDLMLDMISHSPEEVTKGNGCTLCNVRGLPGVGHAFFKCTGVEQSRKTWLQGCDDHCSRSLEGVMITALGAWSQALLFAADVYSRRSMGVVGPSISSPPTEMKQLCDGTVIRDLEYRFQQTFGETFGEDDEEDETAASSAAVCRRAAAAAAADLAGDAGRRVPFVRSGAAAEGQTRRAPGCETSLLGSARGGHVVPLAPTPSAPQVPGGGGGFSAGGNSGLLRAVHRGHVGPMVLRTKAAPMVPRTKAAAKPIGKRVREQRPPM